jgi:septal ring factor EnvC (AmiA/AmiB activator)
MPSKESEQQSQGQSVKASPNASGNKLEVSTGRTYTQDEWNKMQSAKDSEIRTLKTSLRATEGKLSKSEESIDSLTEDIAKLQSEVDSKIPEDSKEYRQQLTEKERKLERERKDYLKDKKEWESTLAEANRGKIEGVANALAAKFVGVDVNALLDFDDPDKMKAYVVDHYEPVAKTATENSHEVEMKPGILTGSQGGTGSTKLTPQQLRSLKPGELTKKILSGEIDIGLNKRS